MAKSIDQQAAATWLAPSLAKLELLGTPADPRPRPGVGVPPEPVKARARTLLQLAAQAGLPEPFRVHTSGHGAVAIRFHVDPVWYLIEFDYDGIETVDRENMRTDEHSIRIIGGGNEEMTLVELVREIVALQEAAG